MNGGRRVTVFGASGSTGGHLLPLLLERGFDVRAVARDPASIRLSHDRLEIVEGDLLDAASVARALSASRPDVPDENDGTHGQGSAAGSTATGLSVAASGAETTDRADAPPASAAAADSKRPSGPDAALDASAGTAGGIVTQGRQGSAAGSTATGLSVAASGAETTGRTGAAPASAAAGGSKRPSGPDAALDASAGTAGGIVTQRRQGSAAGLTATGLSVAASGAETTGRADAPPASAAAGGSMRPSGPDAALDASAGPAAETGAKRSRATSAGADAVIFIAGPRSAAPTAIYSLGGGNVVAAMRAHGLRRLVAVTALGTSKDFVLPPVLGFFARHVVGWFLRHAWGDGARFEAALAGARDVDWTVLRPPALNDGPARGKYRRAVAAHLRWPLRLSRADLARAVIDQRDDPSTFHTWMEVAW